MCQYISAHLVYDHRCNVGEKENSTEEEANKQVATIRPTSFSVHVIKSMNILVSLPFHLFVLRYLTAMLHINNPILMCKSSHQLRLLLYHLKLSYHVR